MFSQPHPIFAENIAVPLIHVVVDTLLHIIVGNPRLGVADTCCHTAVFPCSFIIDFAQHRVGAAFDKVIDTDERFPGLEIIVGINKFVLGIDTVAIGLLITCHDIGHNQLVVGEVVLIVKIKLGINTAIFLFVEHKVSCAIGRMVGEKPPKKVLVLKIIEFECRVEHLLFGIEVIVVERMSVVPLLKTTPVETFFGACVASTIGQLVMFGVVALHF